MGVSDSIATESAPAVRPHSLTPKQVLSWLPKNATPAQQDSAIQLHIKASEIHWSEQPDTLHMPGHPRGKSILDVSLPQYYKESFFAKDSLFHPELPGGRQGVAGDPIPYTIAGDNLITGLLLFCFILSLLAYRQSRRFIVEQVRHFFYITRENTSDLSETAGELRFQLFLALQTCLLFSIFYFFYTRQWDSTTFIVENYQVIGIYTVVMALYFTLKHALYWFTGITFFDGKKSRQWQQSLLFLSSVEGVLLLPLILLLSFFNLSIQNGLFYIILLVILIKILTIYKCYIIFFRQIGFFLQIILYLCALEIVPLAILWGVLEMINGFLKINY